MQILNRIEARVDLDRIEHNFREIKRAVGGGDIIAIIKADAYGHGAEKLGKLYERLGAKMLGVACLDEALNLRRSGIRANILILGHTDPAFAGFLTDNGITQAVASLDYAKKLSAAVESLGRSVKIHIKADTGMSRLGIYAHEGYIKEACDETEAVTKLPNLICEGIFTHFSEAESPDPSFTDIQFKNFTDLCSALKARGITFKFCHCANSAAVVNYSKAHLNCVRAGLILYGHQPTAEPELKLDLLPAMTLTTTIADIRTIHRGDSVSYNRQYVCDKERRIAVVSAGYADGVPRALSNSRGFLICGKRAPVLGNICMDLMILDVTDIPEAKAGDEVVIFGTQGDSTLSVEELAETAGTISYELLCAVSKRVPRTYTGAEA